MSRHFQAREFACPHCGRLVLVAALPEHLEQLRSIIGDRPIRIISGYRCPEHNRAVGGARNSQHLLGKAADIPSGLARFEQAVKAGFTGIGTRGGWVVHVDVRPPPVVHWNE